MRPYLTGILALLMLGFTPLAQAGDQPVVVELYTSQGCSSCPPADALLDELAKRDDVIALALHVDYWDYIGWKDIFGKPSYSSRQRAYARATGQRTVYTPQMIVGGKDQLIGTKAMQLADLINTHKALQTGADLQISRQGSKLTISLMGKDGIKLPRKMAVQLVLFEPHKSVKITRGENSGKTIGYSNIVTTWKYLDSWNGRAAKKISVDLAGNTGPVAVIVQTDGHGPIIAAAQLR